MLKDNKQAYCSILLSADFQIINFTITIKNFMTEDSAALKMKQFTFHVTVIIGGFDIPNTKI